MWKLALVVLAIAVPGFVGFQHQVRGCPPGPVLYTSGASLTIEVCCAAPDVNESAVHVTRWPALVRVEDIGRYLGSALLDK